MGLFKKKILPKDLGRLLYTNIRFGVMSSETPLYHKKLVHDLNEDPENLKWSYSMEILIFALFCTLEVLSNKISSRASLEIMKSIHSEFITHIEPILKPDLNLIAKEQVIQIIHQRFDEYGECLRNQNGAGPVWHLGVKAYWNIIGQEKKEPGPPMILSLYALKLTDLINDILKDYKIIE
ncbi:MAG: hypothetical protein QME78_08760 [Thermodesulfobacteriota bacterium]|nr:hypothetical protein [Thermodesulfobacteriota bacterium]